MFTTRIKVLLSMLLVVLAIVIARLVDMQIVHADYYRQQAEDALLLPVRTVSAVRGRILDRNGIELVTDEPCWEIRVHYGILAGDPAHLEWRLSRRARSRGIKSSEGKAVLRRELVAEIDQMWAGLAQFADETEEELHARGQSIVARIKRIQRDVQRRQGYDEKVREQFMGHPVVSGLDDQQQIRARRLFDRYPWVSVEDANRRTIAAGEPFAHLLGRTGRVTYEHPKVDPFEDDRLRRYLPHDRIGISGIERAAESRLRGWRGSLQLARNDSVIESIEPRRGADVRLTVRADLQIALHQLLETELRNTKYSSGGAIVVLDVASRECLALVSYPAYDPGRFKDLYADLRVDTQRQPLRFRAVANRYAPGSIVKPLACLAGLNKGVIDLSTIFDCAGRLFPNKPRQWRCWVDHQHLTHGPLDVVRAIKHSCNIFMYRTGEALGVDALCNYFSMFGFGKLAGTGLVEETAGINPNSAWLERHDQRPSIGRARMYAIGQAEVSITPLQAANLMAVYASGTWIPVHLIKDDVPPSRWILPGAAEHWAAIRQGLYAVVNDTDGTAHGKAYLKPATGYALCGKTGSAEAHPWPVSYRIHYEDRQGEPCVAVVNATRKADAIADFGRQYPDATFSPETDVHVAGRWPLDPEPEPGRKHSHAWFAGFLQRLDALGQPRWDVEPRIAFAVMVEFGGSGGRVSAPIGRKTAQLLLDVLGPDLDPDAGVDEPRLAVAGAEMDG